MLVSDLAEKYNQFQHAFGQGKAQNYEILIETLFSPHFKKIANRKELVSERPNLLSQLTGLKDFSGNWVIQSLDIIPSYDTTKCTIRYFLNSEKAGNFEIIAILSTLYDQIDRIEEVYYQKEN